MFFNIDADDGVSISGWIAPDNPSSIPRLRIVVPGRSDVVIEASTFRQDVMDLGIHASGCVGFCVSENIIPGLTHLQDILILEADSNIPIYRRFLVGQHVEKKLFLFDASAMPQRRLINNLSSHFALCHTNCERYALETMIVLIKDHVARSILFAGRSQFSRYASFLDGSPFVRAALLRDPLHELAERLLFLKLVAKTGKALDRYITGLAPLVDFAAALDFHDRKALLAAFRLIDLTQRLSLSSPMVRMLGCNLDEPPTHHSVSLALDRLATLDVVGTRAMFPLFRAQLNQYIDANVVVESDPINYPSVSELAHILSTIGTVIDLLEHDISLYAYVEEALKTTAAHVDS